MSARAPRSAGHVGSRYGPLTRLNGLKNYYATEKPKSETYLGVNFIRVLHGMLNVGHHLPFTVAIKINANCKWRATPVRVSFKDTSCHHAGRGLS